MEAENKNMYQPDGRNADDCRCNLDGKNCVNSHFTLAVVAVVLSCFMGFFAIYKRRKAKHGKTARKTALYKNFYG